MASGSEQGPAEREVDYLEFAINDNSRLILSQGDITKWDGDALVNAVNVKAIVLQCSLASCSEPGKTQLTNECWAEGAWMEVR
eukprot:1149447-Pelagomonas_calceolata.AAC.2